MIIANNVTKRFSDVVALDRLSCKIPDSCVYGLVGANGAGKSTFLRLASGVYRPDEGSITMDGAPIFENADVKKRSVFVADEHWALLGCNPLGGFELTLGRARLHPSDEPKRSVFQDQVKTLLRPLRPVFQSGIDNAPDGPLRGWAWWCARMLCSFHFFDAVRKGDTRRPPRPA